MARTRKILDAGRRSECAAMPRRERPQLPAPAGDATLTDEELRDLAEAESDEYFPIDMVKRLLGGEHPVRVFRTYRELTRKQLAAKAGTSAAYLSQIEQGRRAGSAGLRAALARVLEVDAGHLLTVE